MAKRNTYETGEHIPTHERAGDTSPEKLSRKEIADFTTAAVEAIGSNASPEISPENFRDVLEQSMMQKVNGLPEKLAEEAKTADIATYKEEVRKTLESLEKETDAASIAELQVQLISLHVSLISKVQNGGEKGFIPGLAEEVSGLDCSLSAWSLKEKLSEANTGNMQFAFGYPPNHAVGVITDALGRTLYVDAQNALIAEVQLQEVSDPDHPQTAYPIYEITHQTMLYADVQEGGSNFIPKHLGIRPDGILHTLGNFHMLVNKESPTYDTETGKAFRTSLHESPEEWRRFQKFVDTIAGGDVIQETRFG